MVRTISMATAVALVAFVTAASVSFAAPRHKADQENSYTDTRGCTAGSCQGINPDRVPNKSAQFYRAHRRHTSHHIVQQ
jgi:hypothetical protein